ncbi:amidohydrolase [Scatolibacter rhodanostii]|uniref:amidohydrolase n=1 Tax=Scatolibacter rhodanostii TaxID=2014781 RepID=UPI000C087792|nr:amidohydrolase [Scatolibacter rhodanostii]
MKEEFYQELVAIRHKIHSRPELSWQEVETTDFIKKNLISWGIEILETPLKTGVIAQIGQPEKGKIIALRADIDALPIEEQTGLPYASEKRGTMHACGHDFHTTALLGAAYELKQREDSLNGAVRLVFQPAEEVEFGSRDVVKAGHLDGVSAILGFHNHPAYPVGTIALKSGGIMAAVDHFVVSVAGVGGHAAEPHLAVDTIVAISALIAQLQTVVSRNVSAREEAVLSVTQVHAGNTWNVLPNNGFFEGTIRTFDADTRSQIKQRFEEIVDNLSKALRVNSKIEWLDGPGVTFNDKTLTEKVVENSKSFANVVEALASHGGEDFSTYSHILPGVFAFVGSNGDENAPGWHHSSFVVRDEALPTAVQYYVNNAIMLVNE